MEPLKGVGTKSWAAAAFLLLWLSAIQLPRRSVDSSVDDSWQAMLCDAPAHYRQFGTEILLNYGPLGLLRADYFAGGHFAARGAWELAAKAALAVLLLLAIGRLPGWPAQAAAVAAASVLCVGDFDAAYLILVLAMGIFLLRSPPPGRLPSMTVAAVLALLSLLKFTFAILAACVVIGAILQACVIKNVRSCAAIVAGYAIAYSAAWLACGQSLSHIPAFLRSSLEFASGYNAAAFLVDTTPSFLLAAAGLLSLLGALAIAGWDARHSPASLPRIIFCAAVFFLAWKAGIVRADHLPDYFRFCMLASIVVWAGVIAPAKQRSILYCLGLTAAFGLTGLLRWNLLAGDPMLPLWSAHMRWTTRGILHPRRYRAVLDQSLARHRAIGAMPLTSAALGFAPMDFFGNEMGLVFFNGWNYLPRFAFQRQFAYTPALEQINADHFRGPSAPEYVLVKPEDAIDWRYPSLEDGLALRVVLEHYAPILTERSCVLLKRVRPLDANPDALILRKEFGFGETVDLPLGESVIWAVVDVEPSLLGRLRAFLYKPPLVMMHADVAGRTRDFHFVSPTARAGFLLSPLLETTEELRELYRGNPRDNLRSFTLGIPRYTRLFFKSGFEVELYRAPSLDVLAQRFSGARPGP